MIARQAGRISPRFTQRWSSGHGELRHHDGAWTPVWNSGATGSKLPPVRPRARPPRSPKSKQRRSRIEGVLANPFSLRTHISLLVHQWRLWWKSQGAAARILCRARGETRSSCCDGWENPGGDQRTCERRICGASVDIGSALSEWGRRKTPRHPGPARKWGVRC
jgi:hypothetical protein